jgi:hypothetical protein
MKRKQGISTEEFRRFWNSAEFNDLVDEMLSHALTSSVRKSLTLDIEFNKALQAERGAKQPFDGVLEIVWPSGADIAGLLGNAEVERLTRELEEIQSRYIDFTESRRFFTEYEDDRL